jgi:hypothetical protein
MQDVHFFYAFISYLIIQMISPNHLLNPSPAPQFNIFKVLLIHFPKCPSFSTIPSYAPNVTLYQFFPYINSSWLVKRFFFFFLNAAFAMEILNLISNVHLASCFHATQTVKIIHILQLFLIYHNPYCRW